LMWPSVDSSFSSLSYFSMHEPAKAVTVLALSAAVAVWLLGAALHLWPDADQLAYGNPLPYLKVRMDSGAVKFWVEDFGGVPYERVWLYVNGRLAASGGPGTDAAAKCGDEVAAVVKYHSGTKKLEGRILCTQPIKAPGGEVKRSFRLMQVTQAYRAVTGDMDQTGPPLRFDGSCDVDRYGNGRVWVTFRAVRPDVIICVGTNCGTSYTFSWNGWLSPRRGIPITVDQTVSIHVFKVPDAPASQLLGGGRGAARIYIYFDYNGYYDRYDLYAYVNGTLVAECHAGTSVSRDLMSWTEYKEPNATAVYLIRFVGERDGRKAVLDGNIVLYEREDGSFGYRLIVNPVEDPTPADLKVASPHGNLVITSPSNVTYRGAVSLPFILEEMSQIRLHNDNVTVSMDTFFRFLNQLSNDPRQRSMIVQALDDMVDIEFNVPYIAFIMTGEYLVYHEIYSRQSGSATFSFKTLSISSLGAVYANAVLPIDIKLPPPVPPQNATRTYIFSYR
jgi:hypothetical protein